MKFVLPWPPKVLNPNVKKHWRVKHMFAQDYRAECRLLGRCVLTFTDGPIPLRITFNPPDKRKRDDDNVISSFKSGRDGLAEAWGVDDSRFRPVYVFGEPVPGGQVIVEVVG